MALEIAKDGGLARPKILDRIIRFRKFILIIAYLGAYFSSQYLFDPVNMEVTRISEHSLMPGLVTPKFDKSGVAIQLYRRLTDLPKTKKQQKFILDVFSEFGLQCFTQKWKSTIAGYPKRGENVYGFIRGHRNDGAEAQLIVVQLGRSESARRMISRMLAFIDYAKEQVYWARDFVIVFVDGGDKKESIDQAAFALDAFLFKYQKIEALTSKQSNGTVIADEIQSQTGALIAGVVYDLSGMSIKGQHIINIQTNGLNGQQVNLDVFNGIVKIADSKHHSKVAIYGLMHRHASPYKDYSPYDVPLKALFTQAFVSIEGIHSVMGKYGVQGLTVGLSHDYSERQAGQFIEEVSRMLNNVLERLHQSYFMYVLSDDMHFISIALFVIPIGILISPLVFLVYFEWKKCQVFHFPLTYPFIHFIGYMLYLFTTWTYKHVGTRYVFQWTQYPFIGKEGCDGAFSPLFDLMHSFLLFSVVPFGLYAFYKVPVPCVPTMRIFCLVETTLAIVALALTNVGLGIFTSAVVVPVVFLMTYESYQRERSIFRSGMLAILSPMVVLTVVAYSLPAFITVIIPDKAYQTVIGVPVFMLQTMIQTDAANGSWHLFLMTCVAWPVWNMIFASSLRYDLDIDRANMTPPPTPAPFLASTAAGTPEDPPARGFGKRTKK
ncbi:hypothetical protein CRE_03769 [Caenorhabditis remanei]|uniref:Uncharacterized protein n=1 Tax=Caenorhabditis remanei TaxID=31234 RepID=E3LY68_CAERE|nr:hypothetical protein CRE_03769 [Caenorhabditis remanei]